ncbi:MAG: hypothetical protein HFE49_01570 [Clostridia bacterium]|nr:hypothetical protein [Clostridia bacterium]
MKAYIVTIIGATLLAAMAGILAPEKWRSYVQVITGLVIISCIISPVTTVVKSDIFRGFDSVEENIENNERLQTELVMEELKKRVCEDIEARMEKEFNLSVRADCDIRVDGEGAIEGVDGVRVYGDKLTDRARDRLCEVYGLEPYEVENE